MDRSARLIFCEVEPKPKNDDGYFEKMAKTIFRSGFNWNVIEAKWPNFRKAFANFSVASVAAFDADDVDRLMHDESIVRNQKKIMAVIENAGIMLDLKKSHGSFRRYLEAASQQGEKALCDTVVKNFSFIGESMVVSFLRSVGEELSEMHGAWLKQHMKN